MCLLFWMVHKLIKRHKHVAIIWVNFNVNDSSQTLANSICKFTNNLKEKTIVALCLLAESMLQNMDLLTNSV